MRERLRGASANIVRRGINLVFTQDGAEGGAGWTVGADGRAGGCRDARRAAEGRLARPEADRARVADVFQGVGENTRIEEAADGVRAELEGGSERIRRPFVLLGFRVVR